MLAAAFYLHYSSVFHVLTILAAVLAVSIGVALAYTMRAFLILCHRTLCFLVQINCSGMSQW